jgi:LPPG:FO 2-phospho-L-lactate transferase
MARFLAITGGVGGAKLSLGLTHILKPTELGIAVNTGDDFEHLGLHVSPDLDTLMYTLSGLSNPDTGWGRVGESWHFIETLRELGGEGWFNLGDRDLAVHVYRTQQLTAGRPLSAVVEEMHATLGIKHQVWPVTDNRLRTQVETDQGTLDFQHYFVRERCEPVVRALHFEGASAARTTPGLLEWTTASDLDGIIICPSNPFLSIDPLLAVPDFRRALERRQAPCVAISPVIKGAAVKGPTTKIMGELGLPQSSAAVATHYGNLLDGFIIDDGDTALATEIASEALRVRVAKTLMNTLDDRINLAHTAVKFISEIS